MNHIKVNHTKFGLSRVGRCGAVLASITALTALFLLASCGSSETASTATTAAPSNPAADSDLAGTTVTLLTHDSFTLSPGTLETFTNLTGINVETLAVGDAGTLVAQSILNKNNPLGDVLFGIDNTFLSKALNEGIFVPYESPALTNLDPDIFLPVDDQFRVTPVDYGDVCVNYWLDRFPQGDRPTSLDDLTDPAYASQLVVQHPETSSPGLAFLLATIAKYGDGWEDYWQQLRANGVSVTADWNSAYYGEFVAGGGDRSLVVSYASSPPAEVMFAETPTNISPTGVILDGCFRQVEYAGVLAGSENQAAAQALIDFMLSPRWQDDVPLNMFVFPVIKAAELPEVFVEYAVVPENPLSLDPAEIEANRDAWTQRWVEIVLR